MKASLVLAGASFCGLEGGRLQPAILGLIVRRAAQRAGLERRVTAHTLRHTAATWLRQQTGDARLVAAYLGHADLSTVSRYARVADRELHEAAAAIATSSALEKAWSTPAAPLLVAKVRGGAKPEQPQGEGPGARAERFQGNRRGRRHRQR